MRRFVTICESTAGLNLAEATQKIAVVADSIRQNSPQYDDWTFTFIEWAGEAQAASTGRDSTMGGEWSAVDESFSAGGGKRDSGWS